MQRSFDFIIIGGGMAGASAAYGLAPYGRALILEAEDRLAYHTTGRSAAFYSQVYGGPKVQPLTTASKAFFLAPPADLAPAPLMTPRGCLYVAWEDGAAALQALARDFAAIGPRLRPVDADTVLAQVPVLRRQGLLGGLADPECSDMDVHAIHQTFLRGLRRHGGAVVTAAPAKALARQGRVWRVATPHGDFTAPILVNAAGAWGDEVAKLAGIAPLGLVPRRRTIVTFTPQPATIDPAWPLTLDADESFYFKPESGRILASPADETAMPPCDAQPEELDVALTVDRIERATHWRIPRIDAKWAGLRSFVADRLPVYGFAPQAEGFFWCVGQGGWGIQTAPAAAMLIAALITGEAPASALAQAGVEPRLYAPERLMPHKPMS
ncbi:MAG: NAD(P)/FAD-dependent oxidoreductase [Pseudomonadota bacterium]